MHIVRNIIILIITLYLLVRMLFFCSSSQSDNTTNTIKAQPTNSYDLDEILNVGELIAITISGPNSYYEYQGQPLGIQYQLAEKFAQSLGIRLRMEIAKDTSELIKQLKDGEVDLIAYEIPINCIKKNRLISCGSRSLTSSDSHVQNTWAVRPESKQLSEALNTWYNTSIKKSLRTQPYRNNKTESFKKQKVQAPFLSVEKGIISPYDKLFIYYARRIGWDWKLLAAQCYQESAFNPDAVSWAGAKGLMQIMPKTAERLNLPAEQISHPTQNIEAATRYIKQLKERFNDIAQRKDKICFILAAYNGGYYHIRDAMNLAQKYGRDPHSWNDVSQYIKALSQPQYYNDPIVKNGYMIGLETYNYVNSIMIRWNTYQRKIRVSTSSNLMQPNQATKKNRFNKKRKILNPDEIESLILSGNSQ